MGKNKRPTKNSLETGQRWCSTDKRRPIVTVILAKIDEDKGKAICNVVGGDNEQRHLSLREMAMGRGWRLMPSDSTPVRETTDGGFIGPIILRGQVWQGKGFSARIFDVGIENEMRYVKYDGTWVGGARELCTYQKQISLGDFWTALRVQKATLTEGPREEDLHPLLVPSSEKVAPESLARAFTGTPPGSSRRPPTCTPDALNRANGWLKQNRWYATPADPHQLYTHPVISLYSVPVRGDESLEAPVYHMSVRDVKAFYQALPGAKVVGVYNTNTAGELQGDHLKVVHLAPSIFVKEHKDMSIPTEPIKADWPRPATYANKVLKLWGIEESRTDLADDGRYMGLYLDPSKPTAGFTHKVSSSLASLEVSSYEGSTKKLVEVQDIRLRQKVTQAPLDQFLSPVRSTLQDVKEMMDRNDISPIAVRLLNANVAKAIKALANPYADAT